MKIHPRKAALSGAADRGAWSFKSDAGSPKKPDTIFPIFRQEPENNNKLTLLGTGFYITTTGLFLTARHVLMDVFDAHGKQTHPIIIFHTTEDNRLIYRPILRAWHSNEGDVSIGVAAPMHKTSTGEPLNNKIMTLSKKKPEIGDKVVTYAYPDHSHVWEDKTQMINLYPNFYDGRIEEFFPNRPNIGMCYRTSIHLHGGASGGPVIDAKTGYVFGINSSSFNPYVDISFVTVIDPIFYAAMDDVKLPDAEPGRVAIQEMIDRGFISVK